MKDKYIEFYKKYIELCEEYGVDMVVQLVPKEEAEKLEGRLMSINDGRAVAIVN